MADPDFDAIINDIASVGAQLGVFERVVRFEPTSSPGAGLTLAVWMGPFRPIALASGAAATSMLLELTARILSPDAYKPGQDQDPRMLSALSALLGALNADFDASLPTGQAHFNEIDIFGMYSERGMAGEPGFVKMAGEGGELYRIIDLNVPLVLYDVYAQGR